MLYEREYAQRDVPRTFDSFKALVSVLCRQKSQPRENSVRIIKYINAFQQENPSAAAEFDLAEIIKIISKNSTLFVASLILKEYGVTSASPDSELFYQLFRARARIGHEGPVLTMFEKFKQHSTANPVARGRFYYHLLKMYLAGGTLPPSRPISFFPFYLFRLSIHLFSLS